MIATRAASVAALVIGCHACAPAARDADLDSSAAPSTAFPATASSPIDQLTWLAGCWAGVDGGYTLEEQWMAPRGAMMLGMGRVVSAVATVEHEAMRIEAHGSTLIFIATPAGHSEARFTAASVDDGHVVFENPAHDFPQRITYRHAAGDSLHARVEGVSDGETGGFDIRMGRVQCGL